MDKKLKDTIEGDSPGYLLYHLTMLMQRKMKKNLDKIGITHTQFVIIASLYILSEKTKSVTQIDIANQSRTDKMMVSIVLRTLQKKGLVLRQEHSIDTRAKTIVLTKEGKIIFNKAFKIVKDVEQSFFSSIENDLQFFNEKLKALITNNQ
jgi:DNA-binding MarR family transcriptional regulator